MALDFVPREANDSMLLETLLIPIAAIGEVPASGSEA